MRAPRIEGMDFIVQLDEENLPFLNAFDFSPSLPKMEGLPVRGMEVSFLRSRQRQEQRANVYMYFFNGAP
jgi:hypothetical protein